MSETGEHQRARLAYEASLRALDQQQRNLEEIRSRTGALLVVASLGASFLGARAFDRHASLIVTWLALAALVLTLLIGVRVLSLGEQVVVSVSGSVLDAGLRFAHDCADQHRQVANWLDAAWMWNERSIQRLNASFRVMAGALAIQIVLWTVALGATVG